MLYQNLYFYIPLFSTYKPANTLYRNLSFSNKSLLLSYTSLFPDFYSGKSKFYKY